MSAGSKLRGIPGWPVLDGHPVHLFILVLLTAFGVYFNTVFNDFVFDDIPNILQNRWIKDIRHVPDIFSGHLAGFNSGYATSYYRPLIHLIYMLNYYIFGLQPWGFHLVNILFHGGVSILVFLIASKLLEEHPHAHSFLSPAFIAALLFATHPIHTEAVSWVSGFMDLSYTFFYLLSFVLYIRPGAVDRPLKGGYFLSVASFFLAVLCKEPGLTLPALLFIYDRTFRIERFSLSEYAKRYLPYLLVAMLYLGMRFFALKGFAPSKSLRGLKDYQYVLNIFPLFIDYLEKLILPVNLNAMHVFHPINSVFEWKSLVSIIFTVIFIMFAFMMRKERVVSVSLSLIVIPLLPSLYIPGIAGEVVFAERYLYLPSFGFVLLIAFLLDWTKKNILKKYFLMSISFLALAGLYSIGTVSRNYVWKDSYNLWRETVNKSPRSAAAHEYLGYALYTEGKMDEAIVEYRIALSLNPERIDSQINLGVAYHMIGWIDQAIVQYQIALRLRPNDAEGNMNLGLAFISKGSVDRAIEQCQTAINLDPYLAGAHNCLGSAYAQKGEIDKAIKHFQFAVQLNPDDTSYRNNLSMAYEVRKKWKK